MRAERDCVCDVCGKMYRSRVKNSHTCSKKCHGIRLSQKYTGRKLTPEWLANMNASKTREKIRREGEFHCDQCQRVFGSNTGLRSHKAYCSAVDEERNVACEICDKVYKRARVLIWHRKMHDPQYRDEHSKKVKAGLAANPPVMKRNSRPEIEFLGLLRKLFSECEVIHKFHIDGINHEYDFCVPDRKLIIELDGDYWHGNRKLHKLDARMRQQFRKDRDWTEKARSAGYSVHRVWVSEMRDYTGDSDVAGRENQIDQEATPQRAGV